MERSYRPRWLVPALIAEAVVLVQLLFVAPTSSDEVPIPFPVVNDEGSPCQVKAYRYAPEPSVPLEDEVAVLKVLPPVRPPGVPIGDGCTEGSALVGELSVPS